MRKHSFLKLAMVCSSIFASAGTAFANPGDPIAERPAPHFEIRAITFAPAGSNGIPAGGSHASTCLSFGPGTCTASATIALVGMPWKLNQPNYQLPGGTFGLVTTVTVPNVHNIDDVKRAIPGALKDKIADWEKFVADVKNASERPLP